MRSGVARNPAVRGPYYEAMLTFLVWLVLLFVCWPLALLAAPFMLVWGVLRLAFGGVKAALEVVELLVRILTAPFRIAFRRS